MSVNARPGGMFNSYKVQYAPETHKLLKLLMDEVKLTTAQRQQMNQALKKGEPLPAVARRRFKPSHVEENLFDLKKNYYFLRRSQDQILHSGAYERERCRYLERTVDLEKEKEKLQHLMEYGKNVPKEKFGATSKVFKKPTKRQTKKVSPEERLEELVEEVEDRLEFLKEMEALGQAKKYEATMKQEIAGKLREMKKIDGNLAGRYLDVVRLPKNSASKPDAALTSSLP